MKIVVGLGNPGSEYEKTLHNLGFMAIDIVAEKLSCDFFKKANLKAMTAETVVKGEKVILVKPLTFMNLSGEAVSAVVNYYKVPLKDVMIMYDDLDIDVGAIRVKPSGSSGTHNGMRSIVACLNDTAFPRVRIGSKKDNDEMSLIDYVLSKIPKEKAELYAAAIKRAAECAISFIDGMDFDRIMNIYNTRV